ncbi:hypothetical protein SPRG_07200 [Saprolegnia parasitica CBS 223.65]|uniref:E3 ubiquitin protein ligase n=1 Tax=Saprolegnia parasitica (strain CBS 223.65) TaxID=695850 RepID=A0A067CN04_SAPPC|nr:hypothetical protein SPRG_07200 [Saprolegnia parasitica CBS 223.65]KDO27926.1 hypothetical protein SPRG_07200 [Saprolegnia parasitica CBS 223.65]|eukprot:XP_012201382.1 hypothetical protein SPRG_07200 [Saprolegnia parasitica CBS 223.65]
MDHRRKREGDADEPPQVSGKRTKRQEVDEGGSKEEEEGDPIETDKQLRARNTALREVLGEKNRRIQFLETKCSELFAHRHVVDARTRTVLSHWSSLLSTLHTLLPDASHDAQAAIEAIGTIEVKLPEDLYCEINEWYQSGTQPLTPEAATDTTVNSHLRDECEYLKGFVSRLLTETSASSSKVNETEALARAIDAKTKAESLAASYKDQLAAYKQQLREVKCDLERKELERHQACRELDCIKNGSPKARVSQQASELKLEADLRRAMATEASTKSSMSALKTLHDEQLARAVNELAHVKDEYMRFKLKCKDMDAHIHEKWKKKLVKYQGDALKTKAKLDEAMLKNAELKAKITTFASYKDQMVEYKTLLSSYERQVASLQAQLKGSEKYRQCVIEVQEAATSSTMRRLEGQLANLQASYDALQADLASGDRTAMIARDQATRKALAETETKLATAEVARDAIARELELLKDVNHDAELNAIVLEVDAVNREADAMRDQMKKTLQKLSEKETTITKLHQAVAKLEQANAFSFDELAGVRLQVAALQGLQKQQKTLEHGFADVIKTKEEELQGLHAHVNRVLALKDDAEKDKMRALRELEFTKHMAAQPKAEKVTPCEKCETKASAPLVKAAEVAIFRFRADAAPLSELERFELGDLRKKLKCSVCQDALKDVIISKCSHMFCKDCMDANLKARNRKCPTCKKMFGQDDLKSVWWS